MLMKKIAPFALVFLMFVLTSCSEPIDNASVVEPVLPENTILRPSFELTNESFDAGTAFAVELKDKNVSLVLTAYHLFGEDGGLQEQIPASELPDRIKRVTFTDAYNDQACGECDKVLKIADAKTNPSVNKDIAAIYYGDKLNANRLKLSSKLPKEGEAVWLAAATMLGTEPKLHKAKVISTSDKSLIFEYEESGIELTATSGAPIINSSGEVVGLNIGGGERLGVMNGIANPCTSIKKMLTKALKEAGN